MSFFWYISTTKVDALSQQYSRNMLDVFRGLSIKLKSPVAEADLTLAPPQPDLIKRLRRIEQKVISDAQPPPFSTLRDSVPLPPFFSFRGPGARMVNDEEFWLATHSGEVALVLVGAARNTLSTTPQRPLLSPTVDPLGTVLRRANEPSLSPYDADTDEIDVSCSYAWQAVMRHNGQHKLALPIVTGLAVSVASVNAKPAQVRRTGIAGIRHLVIGTPLFVEQI